MEKINSEKTDRPILSISKELEWSIRYNSSSQVYFSNLHYKDKNKREIIGNFQLHERKYLTNVAKVKDYGRNRGNKSQPVFHGEEEGDPLVFRVYNFQTTLFSASEFSITIHANWMKKRFDARIPYCPRGNIFRPWNRIVIDHGCDSHAFHTHTRTHTRDTRWIFSCSFELMKHADYQTLRHVLEPTPAQTHPS